MAAAETTTDRVFRDVREAIVRGELAAGSEHSIYKLAESLGVSRTPVREAVLRLADVGLVTIVKNRGIRIRGVSADDVRAVFELRLLLEVPLARFAARHVDDELVDSLGALLESMRAAAQAGDEPTYTAADRELHAKFAGAFGNPRVADEMSRLRDLIQTRGVSTIGRSRSMVDVAEEHAPIVEAVRRGDGDEAADQMAAHLIRTATLLMRQVSGDDSLDESWASASLAVLDP